MIENARRWRILAGGVAAGMAGVLGFAGNTAMAEPLYPLPPQPGPATVTHTATVMPGCRAGRAVLRAIGRRARRARRAVPDRTRTGTRRRRGAGDAAARHLRDPGGFLQGEGRQARAAGRPRLQGAQHRAARPARLVSGARSECSRRVRGARRPGRWRRHLHLQRRACRLQTGRRQLRSQGGRHPRIHRFPTADRVAHHQCVARRLRRHAVGPDRGHLHATTA